MPVFTRPDKVIVIKGSGSGGMWLAAITGAALAAGALGEVIGRIILAASLIVVVLVAGGLVGLRFALRHAGGRMTSRAEALSAAQAVRGVPPDRAAIAARARPPRGELAAPAVRLVEVRPAARDGKVAG